MQLPRGVHLRLLDERLRTFAVLPVHRHLAVATAGPVTSPAIAIPSPAITITAGTATAAAAAALGTCRVDDLSERSGLRSQRLLDAELTGGVRGRDARPDHAFDVGRRGQLGQQFSGLHYRSIGFLQR